MGRKKPFSGVPGIYTITNLINGKMYVGHTKDLHRRSYEHSSYFNKDNHFNPYLKASCKKYGKENFVFEVLWECEEEFLASEEHYWCNILNVHNEKFGYNILPTNPNSTVGDLNKVSLPHNRVYITVFKYGLDGAFIEEINDYYQYCRDNEFYSATITQALRGDIQTAYRFQWKYEKFESIPPVVRGRRKLKFLKPVYQYNKKGEFIASYTCAPEASEMTGVKLDLIRKCAKDISSHANDFIFLFEEKTQEEVLQRQRDRQLQGEDTILIQMDLEGNEIKKWISVREAMEYYKYDISQWKMSQIVRYSEPFRGFIWKTVYKDQTKCKTQ